MEVFKTACYAKMCLAQTTETAGKKPAESQLFKNQINKNIQSARQK